jgi:signal transduction histidine kinase
MNISSGHPISATETAEQFYFIRNQFISLFLKQNKRAQSGLLLCSVLIFALLLLKISSVWTYVWFVSIACISWSRFVWTDKWVLSARRPLVVIAGLLMINGIALMVPVLYFGQLSDIEHAFITIVLTAAVTASVATTNGYQRIFLWYAAPLFVPLSLAWGVYTKPADGAQWLGWGVGGLLIVYLIFLIKLASDVNRVFSESCLIRFAENALNNRLVSALDEARQATAAKSRFLAAASHDLRQPLHTMGVLLAAIGLRNLDDRSCEIVKMLGSVSKSLAGQLDGLLDISKLDAGVVAADMRQHRLDQIVSAHAEQIEPIGRERGLYTTVHCAPSIVVLTDMYLLQRVLNNLTANAFKFTSDGGVSLTLKKISGQAILEIADTGMGIGQEHQELVFQEFYQVGNHERDRSAGLGLGLAIVRRICALLNINVQMVSSLGQGTRFILTIPSIENEWLPSTPTTLHEPEKLRQLAVLVVDDEADIREGMRLLLDELGCTVGLAASVEQAAQYARQQNFDVIISDFRLRNKETGIEAIEQVRTLQPNIYPLLISGDTDPERLAQAHRTGIAFLHKPVAVDALIKHLRNVG